MTDYTPTTEEVRNLIQGASAEEFERWLNEVKAEAWKEGYSAVTITTVPNPYV